MYVGTPTVLDLGRTLGDGEGQSSLACCSPWGHRVGHDLATEHNAHPLTFKERFTRLMKTCTE